MKAGGEGNNRGQDGQMAWTQCQLNGHELKQAPDGEEQGSLACCSPWGHKEPDTTEVTCMRVFREAPKVLQTDVSDLERWF